MTPPTRWSLLIIAIVVRAASLFYLLVVHPLTISPRGAFDTSTSILLALSPAGTSSTSDRLSKALEPFVKWDNLYFAQIAVRGYQHEQELAFMPVWPLVMRWSGIAVQKLRLVLAIGSSTSTHSPVSQAGVLGIEDVVLGGVIVTNIVSVLNVVAFQKLTFRFTKNHRYTTLCSILYALHPAPAISSVPYTEPFYTLCTFVGGWLVLLTSGSGSTSTSTSSGFGHLDVTTSNSRSSSSSKSRRGRYGRLLTSRRIKNLLLRAAGITCLMLASGTRSLGLLNCVLIVWPLLLRISQRRLRGIFTTLRLALCAGIECLLVISPFAAFQYYAYRAFCTTPLRTGQMLELSDGDGNRDLDPNSTLTRRPWCEKRIPLAYNYVQGHYWDVGFMRYWTFSQLPNFILAAPVLVVSIYGIYLWCYYYFYWYWTGSRLGNSPMMGKENDEGRLQRTRSRPDSKSKSKSTLELELRRTLWENPEAAPFFLVHTITTLILLFASHTQIALRVSMGNPVLFWLVGAFVSSSSSSSRTKYRRTGGGSGSSGGLGLGRTAKWARRWIVWSCTWGAVSLVLWAGFYPPA